MARRNPQRPGVYNQFGHDLWESCQVCVSCEQGKRIENLVKKGGKVEPNPTRGTGKKDLECANYDECLRVADDNEWPAFNCGECEIALTGWSPEDEVSEGLVEAGLEGLRINPISGKGFKDRDCAHLPRCNKEMLQREIGTWNCDFCDLCAKNVTKPPGTEEAGGPGKIVLEVPGSDDIVITDRGPTPLKEFLQMFDEAGKKLASGNKKKGKQVKAVSKAPTKPPRTPQESPKGNSPHPINDEWSPLVLRVYFGRYPKLLDRLLTVAKEEVRLPDQQIIYILKKALKEDGVDKKADN